MKLNELKKEIDRLIEEGYGEYEIIVSKLNNDNSLWKIEYIRLEDIIYYDEEHSELCEEDVLVLYIGDGE